MTDALMRALLALIGLLVRSVGLGLVLILTGVLAVTVAAPVAIIYMIWSPIALVVEVIRTGVHK
jgi:hypothetical protein